MTESRLPLREHAGAPSETISLAALFGLRRLSDEQEEVVRASQLRAADRMFAVRSAVVFVSIAFVDLLCLRETSGWLLGSWTALTLAARLPLVALRRRNERQNYVRATRLMVLYQGALCILQGLIWSLPLLFFARSSPPIEMVAIWTLTSCLMTAVAIGFHPTPLAAVGFLVPTGLSSLLMMTHQGDSLLTSVVVTYALLLLVTSVRQASEFGEQLSTSSQLAEKREVVSLLLREHDREGADWLWQTDANGCLKEVSPALARALGTSRAAIEGQPMLNVIVGIGVPDGVGDPTLQLLAERIAAQSAFTDLVLPVVIRGERRWWELSAAPRRDEKGLFLGLRGVGSDVTTQKESSEQIAQLARYDMLTGLANRLLLTEELTEAIDRVERRGGRCALLMIDLDRFKAVNDSFGHPIGDQLLTQVAERLRQVCTLNEVAGRLGGDEFAVVVRNVSDRTYLFQLGRKIIDTVSQGYTIGSRTVHIGASVGSSSAPQDGRTVSALLRGADLAMYRAKQAGGSRHCAFEPEMQADIEERQLLEAALRDALAKNQLHLTYQPIVAARTGKVVAFEALVCWTHPELGPIQPSRFIPIAEEAQLIGSIGDWVLRNACAEAAHWPSHVRLAINVSPEQLRDEIFLETIVSTLAHSGLPAGRLELEVTETLFQRERANVIPLLDKLMKLGIRLVLDDFGSGQSSIGLIAGVRFSAVKIERAFVSGATRNHRESLAIVRAAIAMAQSLVIDVIAEGVETETDYEQVRGFGFSNYQGFYFGRPMPASEARALFSSRDSRVA